MRMRYGLAVLLPLVALALQWLLWPWITPFVWFLFFPTIFFSARIGGLWGGLLSTVLSTGIVWFFFITPQLSWKIDNPSNIYSILLFLVMGYLFSDSQERLRRAQRKTEEALAETRASSEKISALYQKTLELDELKTQFFANVSHELRTPLTLIISPLVRRLNGGDLTAEARNEDEMMLRNARLLYRHVSDLLDAAKLESGRMIVDYAKVDLAVLTRATASQFETLASEKGITFRQKIPDTLAAEVDSEKLQRILLNLLSNAFKFTPAGGNIELRLQEKAGEAIVELEDNGPGVPANMREAIFERFRQVEGSAQRRFGGTGLGLAIAKEFAQLHGGSVDEKDSSGGGALFTVRLPIKAPAGTSIQACSSQLDPIFDQQTIDELRHLQHNESNTGVSPSEHGKPLILVVEDNADMNAFIANALRPHYRVASAFDGKEGLASAKALLPDLILSDVMMPQMSGDQMVAELRRLPVMVDTPIIMLTAKTDDALRVRLLKEGVQDYLGKPFVVDEMLARVAGLLKERKRSADLINESEARFEATFEQAAMGIALVAPDGRWLRVNRKLCQILGYRQDELLLLQFQDITHPADLAIDLAYVDQMLAGKIDNYSMEKRYLRKDGSSFWVNLSVALLRREDGAPDYFIAVVEDIQLRKEIQIALIASEEALKAAQRLAKIGSWTWDVGSGKHVWSEEIYRIYGRDPSLPAAIYPEVQQYFTEDSWRQLAAVVEHGLAQGLPYECDAEVVRPDGGRRWITARGEAGRDSEGKIINLHGTVQDITERKLAEKEIHRLNADLERRVLERTAELSAANRELDSFAYAVSHDLRAPLRAMSGFSQALVEDYGDTLADEAKTYLHEISIASHKMGELIDGILTLSRSTRGQLQRDLIDISAMATRLLTTLAHSEPQRRLDWKVAPNLQAIGDSRMVEAVLGNLLGNAWKYTGKTTNPSIRVHAGEVDGLCGFCVTDNGAGFDMAHVDQLFQPFRRLHRQDEFPGIGIGLATVQRIVRRHGGEINATASPGVGATFCFSLSEQPTENLR